MVSYIDEKGKVHYVNTEHAKVPERYQNQIFPKPKRNLNQEEGREEEKVESETPALGNILIPVTAPEEPANQNANISNYDLAEILVSEDCSDCSNLELFLNANKVRFVKYDISEKTGQQKYQEVGEGELPITILGEKVIKGFQIKTIYDTLVKDKKITQPQKSNEGVEQKG